MEFYFQLVESFFSGDLSVRELEFGIMNQLQVYSDGEMALSFDGMDLNIDSGQRLPISGKHILKLCDSVLEDAMNPLVLASIGNAIVTFDKEFPLQLETPQDFRAKRVIYEWSEYSHSDIEMTNENIQAWIKFILTGKYTVVWKN